MAPRIPDLSKLTFEDFRNLAQDSSLTPYEKIGFPDSYRKGYEEAILEDILTKLPPLSAEHKNILDIGPGCSDLPHYLIELCGRRGHFLTLIDSAEMLSLLPDKPFIRKVEGKFPEDCITFIAEAQGGFDAILAYSMLHYVFPGSDIYKFFDSGTALLRPKGRLLIADIPNISKRKRFFSSESGIRYHQDFMGTTDLPKVVFNVPSYDAIDDGVIFGLLLRARSAGYDAYVVPQAEGLPMANRREDLLIIKP